MKTLLEIATSLPKAEGIGPFGDDQYSDLRLDLHKSRILIAGEDEGLYAKLCLKKFLENHSPSGMIQLVSVLPESNIYTVLRYTGAVIETVVDLLPASRFKILCKNALSAALKVVGAADQPGGWGNFFQQKDVDALKKAEDSLMMILNFSEVKQDVFAVGWAIIEYLAAFDRALMCDFGFIICAKATKRLQYWLFETKCKDLTGFEKLELKTKKFPSLYVNFIGDFIATKLKNYDDN